MEEIKWENTQPIKDMYQVWVSSAMSNSVNKVIYLHLTLKKFGGHLSRATMGLMGSGIQIPLIWILLYAWLL